MLVAGPRTPPQGGHCSSTGPHLSMWRATLVLLGRGSIEELPPILQMSPKGYPKILFRNLRPLAEQTSGLPRQVKGTTLAQRGIAGHLVLHSKPRNNPTSLPPHTVQSP